MNKRFVYSNNLVIDLGMNNGDDTEYYLKKGYRVLAVEANPRLCQHAKERFQEEIALGRLDILNVAVWSDYIEKDFFINLENDHWSSLDIEWAGRDGTDFQRIAVKCVPIHHLFAISGVPRYMKVDVEGVDDLVISQLHELEYLPYYLSVEDCRFGFQYLNSMAGLGYSGFKLQDQSLIDQIIDKTTGHQFNKSSSGPFGEDINGNWLSHSAVVDQYSKEVRDHNLNRLAPRTHWWDIHVCGPDIGSAI